jgi:uncharacterized membrane protein YoaK (UPF0700 family)
MPPPSRPEIVVPSVDDSLPMMLLPTVLSLTAGSCDVISFIGLGGLFTAHITGNLVILVARVVAGQSASASLLLSVPVFIVALFVAALLAAGLERIGIASLRPMLLLQFLLLCGFLLLCVTAGAPIDPNEGRALLAGMLGVSAMAVQNAIGQVSVKGAPSTAVMTTDVARFVVDFVAVLTKRNRPAAAKAVTRARRTAPAIVGFALGCALGAACEVVAGLWSLALPAGLALVALAIAVVRNPA